MKTSEKYFNDYIARLKSDKDILTNLLDEIFLKFNDNNGNYCNQSHDYQYIIGDILFIKTQNNFLDIEKFLKFAKKNKSCYNDDIDRLDNKKDLINNAEEYNIEYQKFLNYLNITDNQFKEKLQKFDYYTSCNCIIVNKNYILTFELCGDFDYDENWCNDIENCYIHSWTEFKKIINS